MVIDRQEKMLTAYHEGGHAIVALNVTATDPVHKATIIPRGRVARHGHAGSPERDKLSMSYEQMSLAARHLHGRPGFGRARLWQGEDHLGPAQSDIEQATNLAARW